MTIKTVRPRSLTGALKTLTELANTFPSTSIVFRGQRDFGWRLQTTYERYWGGEPPPECETTHLQTMIEKFRTGLARIESVPPLPNQRLTVLEYARHHGLPAPLLDFSWSPYVALYFAFDGVRESNGSKDAAAVYALNLNQLAKHEVRRRGIDPQNPEFGREVDRFLYEDASPSCSGLPDDELLFLRYPSAHTKRMLSQLGVFLYATLSESTAPDGLDGYLDGIEEGLASCCLPNDDSPVLTKVKLPYEWATEVFAQLELMSINGASMRMSAEGVASDVFNSYHYTVRAAYLRRP